MGGLVGEIVNESFRKRNIYYTIRQGQREQKKKTFNMADGGAGAGYLHANSGKCQNNRSTRTTAQIILNY